MMARCGRPELDSCPRVVGRGAPARKRRPLVLAPPKSARNPPPETPEEAGHKNRTGRQAPTAETARLAAPPRNARQAAQCAAGRAACHAAAWTAWKPSLQKTEAANSRSSQTAPGSTIPATEQPTAETADNAKVQTVAGGGDPGCGLNEPGYRTAALRRPPILISPPRSVRGGAVL